ncbi:hypothetical protein [Stenotrophomonas sp. 59]|uniref:hypothetical protein n=1 Tax=Stenotrophomonas sp. 59 TaxID=3051120 RepID=UPI00256EB038|nr:hypothetical protein [Stenotrophomonas sp. 59]
MRTPRVQWGQPLGGGHIDALLYQGQIAARLFPGLGQGHIRIATQDLFLGGAAKAEAQYPGGLAGGGAAGAGHEGQAIADGTINRAGTQPSAQGFIGNQFRAF